MPKKIAMIDPSLFTWAYDKALVEGLREQGHDAILYTKHLGKGEQGKGAPYVKEVFYPGFHSALFKKLPRKLFLTLKGVVHPFSLLALYVRLRRSKPDIIHFQWVPLPIVDRLFIPLFRRVAPVVMTVHDSAPFNSNPSSKLQASHALDIVRDFDKLIVHTEVSVSALCKRGLSRGDIERIEHGILGAPLPTHIAPMRAPSADRPVTILLFGYLKHYKGADILIEALAKMPELSRAKTKVRIIGKPLMDTEPLFARAKALGVDKHISWELRFVDDEEMTEMFESSDIMTMPYREIDASGVLMVALAVGRPIVASRIGLFEEMLEDGKHGFLLPLEDPDALASALTTLVDAPALRFQMGANVRALGNLIPSWGRIAQVTDQLYTRAIAARG